MSDENPNFRTVRHGYDPEAVDDHVAKLSALVESAQKRTTDLTRRMQQLSESAESRLQAPGAPSYSEFGERIGQMLTLAEEEAARIRDEAEADARRRVTDFESANAKAREDADRFASETRSAATQEAARILEDAKRSSDQMLDEAQRQATARREEAEAIYERQRAQAAKAAADFEQTLAERRESAERDFKERTNQAERELLQAQAEVNRLRTEGEQTAADASRTAARLTDEAEAKARQIVADAVARADRIRAESERELSAATQRRDSINAQLTNVRQMLATLTGTTPAGLPDDQHGVGDAPAAGAVSIEKSADPDDEPFDRERHDDDHNAE